jgi:cytochrome d ubiquinol oxidase subunit I
MDPLILARLQFAITTVYHFFFVPLTLGLSILVAIMETLYVRSGNDVYKQMTKFWGKLFLINFAVGVVTGIVQEFQFGMNWSEYSRYVGDIFGAPLAIEALLAFFLESTFLGVWLFGWDKLSKSLHAVAIWLVAIGSNISALWILIANSFMQQPVGYVINNGRAEMTSFSSLVFNPNIFTQFPHVLAAGLTTAALFILGISAYHLLRKNNIELFQRSFKIAAVAGVIATILLGLIGHQQAQHVARMQPMKLASMEALENTANPAGLSLLTISSPDGGKDIIDLRIPALLSLLIYDRPSGEVEGMNELQAAYEATYGPGNYIPPVIITYWSFRAMVGSGLVLIAVTLFALFMAWKNLYAKFPWFLKLLPWAIALPYLANTTGWLLTEVGRFPWVVYGLVKQENGVSTVVSAGMLWISLIGYVVVYGALIVTTIYLLRKFAQAGVTPQTHQTIDEPAPSLLQTPKQSKEVKK